MKKNIRVKALILAGIISIGLLVGCGDVDDIRELDDNTMTEEVVPEAEEEDEEETISAEEVSVEDDVAVEDAAPVEDATSTEDATTAEDAAPMDEVSTEAAPVITYQQGNKFPSFTTYTLDGNVITDDIFSQADVTVINIWGTYCPPCIGEMPELGEWARNMPDNVQLIGLVCDIEDKNDSATISEAYSILNNAGAGFTQMIYSNDLYDFMVDVYAVPTTIFVNRDGYLIGESIIGADVDGYKSTVDTLLSTIQ